MVSASASRADNVRTYAAGFAYAASLFAVYLVSGPLRAVRLDPTLGAVAGATVEAGMFMPVILFGGIMIPAVFRLTGTPRALARIGVVALTAFLIADLIVAVTLCGLSATEHLARFLGPAGWIQGGSLVLFAAFPWLWWHRDGAQPYAPLPARGFSSSGP